MKIIVRATIEYHFDTDDGPVNDKDAAVAEVARMVEEGVDFDEYNVEVYTDR